GNRILGGENCYLCIRFILLPIYPLDSFGGGFRELSTLQNWRLLCGQFPSPSLYGEKVAAAG
ncbi:hypothetical protein, partial [Mesorhizobium sp. B3-2-1]|uniref:hypothetical protein n=1 Tax=Mesorhizobium sp. B3-2-1 TaxID=2589891 RepID=UPI001AEF1520